MSAAPTADIARVHRPLAGQSRRQEERDNVATPPHGPQPPTEL